MADDSDRGPLVPNAEDVYRILTHPNWVKRDLGIPSTAAFSFPKFSVDRAAMTTPERSAARFDDVTHVAEFNVGEAAKLGLSTHAEVDVDYPENDAHAHVYHSAGNSGRKRAAKELVAACRLIAITER